MISFVLAVTGRGPRRPVGQVGGFKVVGVGDPKPSAVERLRRCISVWEGATEATAAGLQALARQVPGLARAPSEAADGRLDQVIEAETAKTIAVIETARDDVTAAIAKVIAELELALGTEPRTPVEARARPLSPVPTDDQRGGDAPTDHEVRRGAVPDGIHLTGRQALAKLVEQYGDAIVFHGSGLSIDVLEPRQPTWKDKVTGQVFPDGPPAVAAAPDYETAIFVGLFRGRRSTSYRPGENGTIEYTVRAATTPEGEDITSLVGHVHVLERKDFELFDGGPPDGWPHPFPRRCIEYRATSPVRPLAVVRVTIDDMVAPIVFE